MFGGIESQTAGQSVAGELTARKRGSAPKRHFEYWHNGHPALPNKSQTGSRLRRRIASSSRSWCIPSLGATPPVLSTASTAEWLCPAETVHSCLGGLTLTPAARQL